MKPKKENAFLSLIFNIAIPSILLIWGGKFLKKYDIGTIFSIDATIVIFLLALAFPIIYGIYDLIDRKKWNFISIIGVVSVFLTGGIGVMQLSREWMIAKETLVPFTIGVIVLITAFTKKPIAKLLIFNDALLDIKKVEAKLLENNTKEQFEKEFAFATWIFGASFLISSILNFLLAYFIFTPNATQEQFNEQVGKMTAMSWPVIVLPTSIILIFAMMRVFKSIKKYTGLKLEDALVESLKQKD